MKLKSAIERPDLELAEKVEYIADENYLKFYFTEPNMIVIVRLGDKEFTIIKGETTYVFHPERGMLGASTESLQDS